MTAFFEYQLKVGGVLALGVLVYGMFLSRDTSFRRNRAWLLGCLSVPWIVPLMAMPVKLKELLLGQELPVQQLSVNELPVREFVLADFVTAPETIEVPVEQSDPITWESVLMIGFALIGVMLLVRLVMGCFSILKLRNKSIKSNYKKFKLRLFKNVGVVPFSFFRTIYAPKKIEQQKDYELILEHESTHCKQLHSVDIMLAELVLLLQWWNPFAWWLRKLIARNHEYCVDSSMLKKVNEPSKYQYLLVNLMSGNASLQLVNSFNAGFTKKRIVMMNKNKSNHILNRLKIVPVVILLLVAVSAFTNPDLTVVPTVYEQLPLSDYSVEKDDLNIFEPDSAKKVKLDSEQMTSDGEVVVSYQVSGSVNLSDINRISDRGIILHDNPDLKITEIKGSPLVMINGKESTVKELNALEREEVENIEVIITGENAVKLYGKKAKDGVVIVTGKKTPQSDSTHVNVDVEKGHGESENDTLKHIKVKVVKAFDGDACQEVIVKNYLNNPDQISYTAKDSIILHKNKNVELYGDVQVEVVDKQGDVSVVVDGEEVTIEVLDDLDPHKVEEVIVLQKDGEEVREEPGLVVIEKKAVKGDSATVVVQTRKATAIAANHRSFKFKQEKVSGGVPLVIINGEEKSLADLSAYDSSSFETITVIKDKEKTKVYGDKAKDGVLLVTLKEGAEPHGYFKKNTWTVYDINDKLPMVNAEMIKITNGKQLYIIDEKIVSYKEVNKLKPENIEKVEVLKGDKAKELYGKKAKHGVIKITTKK